MANFRHLRGDLAVLIGPIERDDIVRMKNWLRDIKINLIPDSLLIVDCPGGLVDASLLNLMVEVPVHIHVAAKAMSFAGCMAMCGSYVSMDPDSVLMFHAPEIKDLNLGIEGEPRAKDILKRTIFSIASTMATVLPCTDLDTEEGHYESVKDMVLEALENTSKDTYVMSTTAYHCNMIDEVVEYTADDLKLKGAQKVWYNGLFDKEGR